MTPFKFWKTWPLHVLIALSSAAIFGNVVFSQFAISRQERDISSLEEKAALLDAAVSGRGGLAWMSQARLIGFADLAPSQNELPALLRKVFDVARENNLKVPEGDYSAEPARDGRLSKYTFTLPVKGKYGEIKRFIYGLEASELPIAIDELTLAKGKEGGVDLSLNIRISVLYR